jgi:hypothetical protein
MTQNREVEVSTLILEDIIGSGAIPEKGVSRRSLPELAAIAIPQH